MSDPTSTSLSEYVDLVNAHGSDSSEAQAFRQTHANDAELIKLMDKTDQLKRQLQSGVLKLDPQGNFIS